MSGRELPESLRTVLGHARDLEAMARGTHRERAAISATSALLLAANKAGWQQAELATALGMRLNTVHKRITTARRTYGDNRPAIVVDVPLDRPPSPLAVLRLPGEEREWLTVGEAAQRAGRHVETVYLWLRRGVLPNTDRTTAGVNLYLKADIDRVLRAQRYGRRPFVDLVGLREAIEASPV